MFVEIKIFNLNCWLLPTPLSSDNWERLGRIVKLIKKYDPDIVALQEVWRKKYADYLQKELREYFCYAGKKLFNRPGLVTLLKVKPLFFKRGVFRKSKKFNRLEKFASKGYQRFLLKIRNKKFIFINTHLYTAFNPDANKQALTEFEYLKKLCGQKKVVLVGDLNIGEKTFEKLNNGFFKYESDKSLERLGITKYRKKRFSRFGQSSKRVDYILVRGVGGSKIKLNRQIIKKPEVSDHFPRLVTLRL